MSEPFWTPLGGQPVDYEGDWNAGTQYAPGDVVVYGGVTYLAVNPSLGSTPPLALAPSIGTSFPGSPVDGQEFILVDSLTAPTYQWRFRYISAKATNKWVFVGGAPNETAHLGSITTSSTSFVDLTSGPTLTVPVAGQYLVRHSCGCFVQASSLTDMIAVVNGSVSGDGGTPRITSSVQYQGAWLYFEEKRSLVAETLKIRVRNGQANSALYATAMIGLLPVAVGG